MARCATGAGRRSGALSRGDRDASLSLSLAACDSQRAITTRALRAPVDASSVASGRRRNETEPGAVGKANRAPLSRSPRTFCRREAPRRGAARGARRRSCARARTCWRATEAASHARGRARRCGAASRARKGFRSKHVSSQHARFPWLAVLAVTNFHVRGFFSDSAQRLSASFRHTPRAPY